jgi:hypothetical protein
MTFKANKYITNPTNNSLHILDRIDCHAFSKIVFNPRACTTWAGAAGTATASEAPVAVDAPVRCRNSEVAPEGSAVEVEVDSVADVVIVVSESGDAEVAVELGVAVPGRGASSGVHRSGKMARNFELLRFQACDLRLNIRFSSVVVFMLPVVGVSSSWQRWLRNRC